MGQSNFPFIRERASVVIHSSTVDDISYESPNGLAPRQALAFIHAKLGIHLKDNEKALQRAAMGTRRGCFQCTKRRIFCDQTEPQCLKCAAKGLECSGNGVRYRFNDGIASRGKFRGHTTPAAQNCKSRPSQCRDTSQTRHSASCLSLNRVQNAGHSFNSQVVYAPQAIDTWNRVMMDFCKFHLPFLRTPIAHNGVQFQQTWHLGW